MDLVFLRRLDSLPAVICRDGAVPLAGQVDIQCGDDVPAGSAGPARLYYKDSIDSLSCKTENLKN